MHMLRDEDGAGYRKVIRETIEFDPEILKRYVNFMSNPDEKTALEQFGKGDKYFGVATVLATLPGLPMLGHGQVQGLGEKYGMEFRRATLDERPDPDLVARHERQIFPLLHRRAWFAEAHDFLLYDFVTDGGAVDEHVLAYSNGSGPQRSLVVYHDRFGSTSGSIRDSATYALKAPDGSKRLVRRSLAEGLGLPNDPGAFAVFRDSRTGLESLRSCRAIWEHGLHLSLDAYAIRVYWEFREVRDGSAGQWARLATKLGETEVPSVDDALRELQLQPVHRPFRAIFADGLVRSVLDGTATHPQLDALERRYAGFLAAIAEATGVTGDPAAIATGTRARTERVFAGPDRPTDQRDRAALLVWLGLARTGALAAGADVAATSEAWYDELRLPGALATGLHEAGFDEAEAWSVADLVRVLLALPRPSTVRGPARSRDSRLLEGWLTRGVVRTAIGLNTWQGLEYVDRDAFVRMLEWAVRLDAVEADAAAVDAAAVPAAGIRREPGGRRNAAGRPSLVERLSAAAEIAGYRVDRLRTALAPASSPTSKRRPR
jgi:hypothetical protein